MNRFAPALVAATLLLTPAVSPAQSLGEVAEKEKEKKEKDKSRKPAKTYSEEDLRGKLGGTMSNPGASASVPGETTTSSTEGTSKDGADATPAAETSPSAAELEAKQAEWRARKGRIEQEVVRINASINSFQARLADNTVPMYGPGREALVQNLERAKADLVRAQADLASAEQEGRTNGYR